MTKIITSFVFPPIPDRDHDWLAYYADTEESGRYGYGPTEAAAMRDLVINWPREDCPGCKGWGHVPRGTDDRTMPCNVCHGLGAEPPHHPLEIEIAGVAA